MVNLLYHKIVKNSRLFFEPIKRRIEILKETGRIEFREGIIDKLIKEFCDSPDELIEFIKKSFDGIAQGDLEYLIR